MTLSQVVYEGNPAPGYNYVLSTFREGAPPGERAVLDAAAKKVAGMTYGDYLTKASAYRARVGQVLSRQVATAGTEPVKEGDIIRVDFMKTAEGRAADYFDMERNEFKAIHEQNIKKGAVKRWAVWPAALPPGDGVPYDAMTTAVYRDMASALQRPRYEAAFREARPDQSFAGVSEKARTTRKRVRSEARRVAWVVSRPN